MTDAALRLRVFRVACAAAALVVVSSRPAHACHPECGSEEIALGVALGVGASGMVALLAPLAARDVFARDASKPPSYATTAAIAGGTAIVTVAVTAIAFAATADPQGGYVLSGGQAWAEVAVWVGPPLILGTAAALTANLLLRVPESRPGLSFAAAPTRSGAAGMLQYSF